MKKGIMIIKTNPIYEEESYGILGSEIIPDFESQIEIDLSEEEVEQISRNIAFVRKMEQILRDSSIVSTSFLHAYLPDKTIYKMDDLGIKTRKLVLSDEHTLSWEEYGTLYIEWEIEFKGDAFNFNPLSDDEIKKIIFKG